MKKYEIEINGEFYEVTVRELEADADMSTTQTAEKTAQSKSENTSTQTKTRQADGATDINAPMSGTILKVNVNPGQKVSKGDTLLVLEAMKMENEVVAPKDGVVQEVHVRENDRVASSQLLVTL